MYQVVVERSAEKDLKRLSPGIRARVAAQSKTFDAMLAKEDKINEAYLEALARRSEAAAKVIEAEYRILHVYDHRRGADWDAMPPGAKGRAAKADGRPACAYARAIGFPAHRETP